MGGFEGGDEGGFWDIDILPELINKQKDTPKRTKQEKPYIQTSDSGYSIKAHAKINIFQKFTRSKDSHPIVLSRVIRVEDVYDTISFVPCKCDGFSIEGCDDIALKSNSIYQAYQKLCDYTADSDIEDFFHEYKVVVTKRIPTCAGLAGASSDAASFLRLTKEVCNLVISTNELVNIGNDIRTDMAFFIYNYPSANVLEPTEVVEYVEKEALSIELCISDIKYNHALVYQTCKERTFDESSFSLYQDWEKLDSKSILKNTLNPVKLNDLYTSALLTYPELNQADKQTWFLSGSTFFKLSE